MTALIKKAKRGNKEAFITLYERNKETVLYVCETLLCDFSAADSACIHIFKNMWQLVGDGKIESENEFRHTAINKAVNYCKIRIAKGDSRAFKIPQNKNFTVSSYENVGNGGYSSLLAALPAIHRFIYVLDGYLGWSEDEIAEALFTKADSIRLALDYQKVNFDRFSASVKQATGKEVSISIDGFKDYLDAAKEDCETSNALDSAVIASIDAIIEPIMLEKRRKTKKVCLISGISLIAAIALVLSVIGIVWLQRDQDAEEDSVDDEEYEEEYADLELDWITSIENPSHYAVIDVADYGKITVALDETQAPVTVENFVTLAKAGFYDGLTFHRIIEGFMMQGGDPKGDGTGGNTDESGKEKNIVGEFYYNGYENLISHTRGAISMARANDYDSASSQFFIVHEDCTGDLNMMYAAFGFVTEGMDVVDKICADAEPTDYNGTIEKADQPIITSIKVYTPEEYAALEKSESAESESNTESTESKSSESAAE